MIKNKEIYVDIDDTICYYADGNKNGPKDYSMAIPDQRKIDIVNKLYDDGNKITMWTARGSVTGIDWYDITKKQLDEWGVKYHELKMKKPFYDILIDDRALTSLETIYLIDRITQ